MGLYYRPQSGPSSDERSPSTGKCEKISNRLEEYERWYFHFSLSSSFPPSLSLCNISIFHGSDFFRKTVKCKIRIHTFTFCSFAFTLTPAFASARKTISDYKEKIKQKKFVCMCVSEYVQLAKMERIRKRYRTRETHTPSSLLRRRLKSTNTFRWDSSSLESPESEKGEDKISILPHTSLRFLLLQGISSSLYSLSTFTNIILHFW